MEVIDEKHERKAKVEVVAVCDEAVDGHLDNVEHHELAGYVYHDVEMLDEVHLLALLGETEYEVVWHNEKRATAEVEYGVVYP